jgi:hypothetical protein
VRIHSLLVGRSLIPVVLGAALAWTLLTPQLLVAQGAQPAPDASLGVDNVTGDYTVDPGQILSHHMTVSLGSAAATGLDMQVDARGLSQGPDGGTIATTADQDTTPLSGRAFITSIDHPTFHLDPGGSQAVTATIAIPKSLTAGIRYADIYIHSNATGNTRVGYILATHIPLLLTVAGSSFTEKGSIAKLDVPPVESGKPISVTATFKNTGDHHFKADADMTLSDASGKQVASEHVPQAGSSILPGVQRAYTAHFGLFDKLEGLPVGTYTAAARILNEDGNVLDSSTTTFQITAPYLPFPDLDPATIVIVRYNNEVPYPIDARAKADLLVSFTTPATVTGTVVLGRFKAEPSGTPRAADSRNDGGLGKPGVKYWGIGVQGFSQGTAQITAFYRDTELGQVVPSTLFLGDRPAGAPRWSKFDNQGVFPNAQNARGEIGVSVLNGNPVIALASEPPAETDVAGVEQVSLLGMLSAYWPLGVVVLLILAIGPSIVLLRTRRRKS